MADPDRPDALRRAALDLIDAGHVFLDAVAAIVEADAEMAEDAAVLIGRALRGVVVGLGADAEATPVDDDEAGGWETITVEG